MVEQILILILLVLSEWLSMSNVKCNGVRNVRRLHVSRCCHATDRFRNSPTDLSAVQCPANSMAIVYKHGQILECSVIFVKVSQIYG